MSHAEYIARCDEDQLVRLVEMANEKLKQIRQSEWVKIWVVRDDSLNLGWFERKDYSRALEFLAKTGAAAAAKGKACELGIRLEKYRPHEAAQLVDGTSAELRQDSPRTSST